MSVLFEPKRWSGIYFNNGVSLDRVSRVPTVASDKCA